jgi:protein-tyrosine phosphatase
MIENLDREFAQRHILLAACFNFRDIGGYAAHDGRTTRWRTLYRSGALHRMTGDDAERVQSLRLASVLDLRRPDEAATVPIGPLQDFGIRRYSFPLIPEGGSAILDEQYGAAISAQRYLGYLMTGEDQLKAALEQLADGSIYPAVIHCSAGKDRTGVLVAVLLSVLGVDRSAIVRDYALTNCEVERTYQWLVSTGGVSEDAMREGGTGASVSLQKRLEAPVSAIEGFLDELEHRHGSIRRFVSDIGVSDAVVRRLEEALLEER